MNVSRIVPPHSPMYIEIASFACIVRGVTIVITGIQRVRKHCFGFCESDTFDVMNMWD